MHWAYYLVITLIVLYFLLLFLKRRYNKKHGIRPNCECGGKGKFLVEEYRARKKKEAKARSSGSESQ